MFFFLVGFLISWSPFFFIRIFGFMFENNKVSPLVATLPALFAQSSFAWPALFILFGNEDVNKKLCCLDESIRRKSIKSIVNTL